MRQGLLTLMLFATTAVVIAQPVHNTFTSTRILNSHSNETLQKRQLEFRIVHRFGDIAGANGGFERFFGFDDARDIRIALEYGLTDNLLVGLGRNKGAHQRSGILDFFGKYALLRQASDNKMPVSLALHASGNFTAMKRSSDTTVVANFPELAHRFTYATQLIVTRKFGERLSLALLPTFVHRNFVLPRESNDAIALGGGLRFRVFKHLAVLVDYYYPFTQNGGQDTTVTYYHPLGIGFELETGGHIFLINFTNSMAITEAEFIPNSPANWAEGEFRFGFTIARKFKI